MIAVILFWPILLATTGLFLLCLLWCAAVVIGLVALAYATVYGALSDHRKRRDQPKEPTT